MKILAIETSSDACSLAISTDNQIFQKHKVVPQQHASVILQWISTLLEEANLSINALTAVAYSCGPGSFTGIRIGAAVGQGISLANDIPLIAIPSLQVIAQGVFREYGYEKIRIFLNARMEQVYSGYYEANKKQLMTSIYPDAILSFQTLRYIEEDTKCALVTDMLEEINAQENFALDNYSKVISDFYPNAYDVLEAAKERILNNELTALEQSLPIYIRENAWKKLKEQ